MVCYGMQEDAGFDMTEHSSEQRRTDDSRSQSDYNSKKEDQLY